MSSLSFKNTVATNNFQGLNEAQTSSTHGISSIPTFGSQQENIVRNNNSSILNVDPVKAFQFSGPTINSHSGYPHVSNVNNTISNGQNQSFLSTNVNPFTLPYGSFNPTQTHAVPRLSSIPLTHNYFNSSIPHSSNAFNPSFLQQNNSFQTPAFMYNNSMPASTILQSHTNNLTADVSLSTSQVAARQAISKDLPNFCGNPEEWPIFITNYVQSTERCGFTDQENLIRLQKCLKGQALEAVRGKLMMPATVNFAIETLRMLYGRPEIIHHALQIKLKEHIPVRKDKLDTLIQLALAVQNYRTTMQAMGLGDYLNDPMLLDDLVQKLPCDLKLDWGRYRCSFPRVDIIIFDGWLYNLATCASHVTTFTPTNMDETKGSGKERLHLHDTVDKNTKNYIATISCLKCSQSHRLAECPEFLSLSVNERWNFIRESNLCLRCFKKHSLRRCFSKKQCDVDNCKMPHNPLLHNVNLGQHQNKPQEQSANENSSVLFHKKENKSLFRYVPVTLYGKTHSLNTFALIDEGSSCTLIENELALELGLDGPAEELCLQWTGDITQTDESSKKVYLQISPRDQVANKMALHNVRTISNLDLPIQTLTKEDIAQNEHLKNISNLSYTSVKAKLLIGLDNAKLCVPLEIRESANDGLIAIRCRIGWGVYGRQYTGSTSPNRVMHVCPCNVYDRMDELIQNYFSLDSIGIKLNINPLRSKEDERAKSIMESTTKYIAEKRSWETGLLWKYETICLPDSLPMARRRLFCLEAKINKNDKLKSFLVEKIKDYERKGYVRKLQKNEISYGGKSWFIPIFTVINKNKNKIRIVWDAAAAVENVSLNSVLLKGPDLLKSLLGVILRFRERPIAIAGDIREMFHQIRVTKVIKVPSNFYGVTVIRLGK
ncbi:uncharacterized protein LOC119613849 [Lucilia sericata]|uniref:uncharacterized protein LOC119613849 n=1 Tax=Lucilia sericata TaxID=13632 RepID=UPI0018A7FF37|nr:uncharacterized protein LOC119613849 [Lucilia sericata]